METNFLFRIISLLFSHLPVFPVSADFFGIGESICDWAKSSITESIKTLIGIGDTMNEVFTGGGVIGPAVADVQANVVGAVMPAASSLGVVICFACWLFAVIELAIQDRLTPETFVKSMARLVFGMVAIDLATVLFDNIAGPGGFGDAFSETIKKAVSKGSPSVTLTFELEPDEWFTAAVNAILFNTVCLLATGAMTVVSYIVQITRIIEIAIRGSFLGIAVGMLADDGWKGPGGRYLKKFLAVCCQGGVLVLIGAVISSLMASFVSTAFANAFSIETIGEYWTGMFMCIGVGLAGISIMFKSLGYLNDLFGA